MNDDDKKDLEEVKTFFKHLNLSDDFWELPYVEADGALSKQPYCQWMAEGIRDFKSKKKIY